MKTSRPLPVQAALAFMAALILASCGMLAPGSEALPLRFDVDSRTLPNLPPRLGLGTGAPRLSTASINSRGTVRALVFPVSVGERLPVWSDSMIAYDIIGTHRPPAVRATAGFLVEASQGLFRLEASVFPHLVDTSVAPEALADVLMDPAGVKGIVEHVVATWAERVNLAAYDNDGPDGHPMSGDDDGVLDLTIVLIETDSTPAIVRVPSELSVFVGRDRRLRLHLGTAYVLAIPRRDDAEAPVMGLVATILGAAGLAPDEMFFPESLARQISTLARLRLGWLGGALATHSREYELQPGVALVVPLVDVDRNRGLWLLELDGDVMFLTRVIRQQNGHFATTEVRQMQRGDADIQLPLTATEGEHGAQLRVTWPLGEAPRAAVALTRTAVQEQHTHPAEASEGR